jgi:DNA-directed RNA polymerase alpha subunit
MAGTGAATRREPRVQLRKVDRDYCEFVLSGTDVSMANALRRIILVEVRLRFFTSLTAAGVAASGRAGQSHSPVAV